jgi:7-keto-8-aminopelargonate synthetase-like enzyme
MTIGELEAELRAILVPYEDVLDAAEIYHMEVLRRPGAKAHDWFAGVQRIEGSVKFNFLPMHGHPELLDGLSPALLRRRTGASVFRLTEADSGLIEELEALVARGFDAYMGSGPEPK